MRKYYMVILIVSFMLSSFFSYAYEHTKVHPEITVNVVDKSMSKLREVLENVLAVDMAFLDKDAENSYETLLWKIRREKIKSNGFLKRIVDGSTDEDEGKRSLNHFYDPTKGIGLHIPWTIITATAWMNSSYRWGYDSSKNDKNFHNTLDEFESSVTAPLEADRETSIKEMLYCLGHLVHLIEDCAVPAHVRNDKHIFDTKTKLDLYYDNESDRDFYEKYTYGEIYYSRWKNYTSYSVVDISQFNRMSKFWDWNMTSGEFNDNSKGLAEFTNHNFVSKDTNIGNIFDRIYRMNMMEIV